LRIARWAILAVWEDDAARDAFIATSPVLQRWRDSTTGMQQWNLTPIASRGTWKGVNPFPGLTAPEDMAGDMAGDNDRAVAVLTSATVRASKLIPFQRALGGPDSAMKTAPGCQMALGIGEWPIGHLATFSVWDSATAVRAYAYENPKHREVIRRTYAENWYSEELFCRFSISGESSA